MDGITSEFLQQYERLNSVFSGRLSDEKGIDAYVREMDATADSESAQVPFWHEDLKTLKRMQYLKEHSAEEGIVTNTDMYMLYNLYSRVFISNDALSLLLKIRSGEYKKVDIEKLNIGLSPVKDRETKKEKYPADVKLIIGLLSLSLVLLLIFTICYIAIN